MVGGLEPGEDFGFAQDDSALAVIIERDAGEILGADVGLSVHFAVVG
jgi:hypothetical protein